MMSSARIYFVIAFILRIYLHHFQDTGENIIWEHGQEQEPSDPANLSPKATADRRPSNPRYLLPSRR